MHPFLMKCYAEKAMLWAGIGALNAPLAFLPMLASSYILRRDRNTPTAAILQKAITLGGFRPLDSASPIALMANEMGHKVGVTFTHLYKTDHVDFENVMIWQERRDEAALLFQGNPLTDPDLVDAGQQQQFLRGILAHELGHTHTRGTNHFQHNATFTNRLYAFGAGISMCIGWGAMLFGNFVTGAGFIGGALAGAVAGTAALVLRSRNSKNDEYLADIHGAQIFGADDLIITHDFAVKVLNPQMDKAKNSHYSAYQPGLMERLYEQFVQSTHPSSADRITALRAIFKSTASFNLAGEAVSQQRFMPQSAVRPIPRQATRIEPQDNKPQ